MKFIIEKSWNDYGEAQDIINYCDSNEFEYKLLTFDEIYNYDSYDFFKSIYFCNTDLVQYHLSKVKCSFVVPNTYDTTFSNYYDRTIEIMKLSDIDIKQIDIPIFINCYYFIILNCIIDVIASVLKK